MITDRALPHSTGKQTAGSNDVSESNDALRVLIVDDAPETRVLVRDLVVAEGFRAITVSTGEEALQHARSTRIDFVVLDVQLPGIDGVEVCRRLRTFSNAYIVMLSSLSDEADRLVALHSGADDYMIKPFFPKELTARMRVLLRRSPVMPALAGNDLRVVGPIELDSRRHEVSVGGRVLELTKMEFGILELLSRDAGAVVTHEQLLRQLWGNEWLGDHHLLHIHVSNVRRKVGPEAARHVSTVRGVGYRLKI